MGVTLEAIGGHWRTILNYFVKNLTTPRIHTEKNLKTSFTDEK
jgi:hypothetical protein